MNTIDEIIRFKYKELSDLEVPKLTTKDAQIASDYYASGWKAGISYSLLSKNTTPNIDSADKKIFNATSIQIATVMALNGTDKQKEEARIFLLQFLINN